MTAPARSETHLRRAARDWRGQRGELPPAVPIPRAATLKPLSPMQEVVATLLGTRLTYRDIAQVLSTSPEMVRYHAKEAAKRIPGDLPALEKVRAWARGASADVLTGSTLKGYLFTFAQQDDEFIIPPPHRRE